MLGERRAHLLVTIIMIFLIVLLAVPNTIPITKAASQTLILRPNAPGTYTEWPTVVPSGTQHWDAVNDETPDNDSSYIQTSSYKNDTFNLPDISLPTGASITNVTVYATHKKVTYCALYIMIRTHGTNYLSPKITPGTSYMISSYSWAKNPYTNSNWTVEEVNALEAGVRGTYVRVTQVYVEVTYTLPPAAPPVANFTWSPPSPQVGEQVTFNGSLSTPDGGSIVSYEWDFGDGSPHEFGEIVNHTYSTYGTFTVTLNVTDDEGKWDTESKNITVREHPVADFTWSPSWPQVGETVTFNGSLSTPDGGTIISYEWDFGDGSPHEFGEVVTHAYSTYGEFTVTLNVTDSEGKWDTESKTIMVREHPFAEFTWSPDTPMVGETVTFNGSLSTPDGGYLVNYTWNFGDGTPIVTEGDPITTHVYTTHGKYNVTLTVLDSEEKSASIWKIVKVYGEPHSPVAIFVWSPAIPLVNETVTFNASASQPGFDGMNICPIAWYYWDFGNGIHSNTTDPIIEHSYELPGTYNVTLTVYAPPGPDDPEYNPYDSTSDSILVVAQLSVSISPTSSAIYLGQSVNFNSTVSGGVPPYTYQWYVNETAVPGANSSSWIFTPTATGFYVVFLEVTDNMSLTAVSNEAYVTVSLLMYYLTVGTDPAGIVTIPGEGWHENCTHVDLTAPAFVPNEGGEAGQRYRFSHWTVDGNNVSGNPISVHMDANHTAIAHYVKQYYLTIVSPYGVTSGQGWYDNGSVAYAVLNTGIIDHLNGTRRVFTQWSGDASGTNYAQSNPITMNAPKTATANWKTQYYLTVMSPYGTPGGMGWYDEGSVAYATLNTGVIDCGNGTRRVFTHWSGDASGTNYAQSNPITMNSNKTAIANWKTQYYLTVVSPYATPSGEGWYDSDSTAYASVSTNIVDHGNGTRRVFVSWTGDATGTGTTSDPITMNAPKTAIANWKTQYYLTVTSPYGTPGGMGWYDSGSTAYATLNIGSLDHGNGTRRMFTQWSGDTSGTNYAQSNPITMNRPKTAVANWKTQYYLTVTSPYGSPTPTSGWFDAGTPITASVTSPWPGTTGTRYVCTGWTGTGSVPSSGTGTTVSFTINMPSNITWTWKTQYLLTVRTDPAGLSPQPTRNPSGEAGPAGSWWYDESTDVLLTAQSVPGYTFLKWDVQGTDVPGNPIGVHMNMPLTATAHYEKVCAPVGGVIISMSKAETAATPWTELISAVMSVLAVVTAVIVFVFRRRGKKAL